MHADDWAIHNENRLLKRQESEAIRREVEDFINRGGKIYYARPGESKEVSMKEDPAMIRSRERLIKKNQATKGRITENQRKIMSAIRTAMNGTKTIAFDTVQRIVQHRPENLRKTMALICKHGFFDFDGTTITARMV